MSFGVVFCLAVTILSVSTVKADFDTRSRINHICFKSYDYYLCEDILLKHLLSNVTDYKGLTEIALFQTLLYTSDALVFIGKSQSNEPNKTLRDLYQVCVEGYNILLNQFQDAVFQLKKNDIKSMLFDTSRCERFVNDCESVLGSKVAAVHTKNHVAKVLVKMSNVAGELIGTNVID